MSEKLESCPDCGCTDGQSWIYDGQVCKACGCGMSAAMAVGICGILTTADADGISQKFLQPEDLVRPDALAGKTDPSVLINIAERELRAARSHIDSLTALLAAATLRLSEGAK